MLECSGKETCIELYLEHLEAFTGLEGSNPDSESGACYVGPNPNSNPNPNPDPSERGAYAGLYRDDKYAGIKEPNPNPNPNPK